MTSRDITKRIAKLQEGLDQLDQLNVGVARRELFELLVRMRDDLRKEEEAERCQP